MNIPHKPFYFVRHGETDLNKNSIIMGSIDNPLNETGYEQSRIAANILAAENFDIIISSPRMRAQQTATIIAEKVNKTIYLENNLAERVWGEAEGKPANSAISLFDEDYTPQGAETFAAFQQRVINAISTILMQEQLPLIVSHGGVFKALTHHLGYKDLSSSNCAPYVFKPPLEPSSDSWFVCDLNGDAQ